MPSLARLTSQLARIHDPRPRKVPAVFLVARCKFAGWLCSDQLELCTEEKRICQAEIACGKRSDPPIAPCLTAPRRLARAAKFVGNRFIQPRMRRRLPSPASTSTSRRRRLMPKALASRSSGPIRLPVIWRCSKVCPAAACQRRGCR